MWGKLHRELIVITIISVLILAVSFAFNFSASQKDILERQTYDYLLTQPIIPRLFCIPRSSGRMNYWISC